MLEKDQALCIRTLDYSETSQIVTLFTKQHGKIDAIAKGSQRAKSAFDGRIEIFSYGQIVFKESSDQKLSTLTEFSQQPLFADLRNRLFALNCSLFAAELIEKLTIDYDPHPELFERMLDFLQNQTKCKNEFQSLGELISFQLALLAHIGSGLVLDSCVNCKTAYSAKWLSTYFSSSLNGLICNDCEASFSDKIRLDKTAVNLLATEDIARRSLLGAGCELRGIRHENRATDYTDLKKVEKILIYHFTQLLHHPPKMAAYFTK